MPAFSFIQDTPLGARRLDQLSCARFRDESDGPLLLVNHWIPPFPPSVRLNEGWRRDSTVKPAASRVIPARVGRVASARIAGAQRPGLRTRVTDRSLLRGRLPFAT